MASSGSTVERGGEETTSGGGLRDGSGGVQLGVETLTADRPPFYGLHATMGRPKAGALPSLLSPMHADWTRLGPNENGFPLAWLLIYFIYFSVLVRQ